MYCILFLLITWISIQCIELDFLLKPPFNFFESKMTDAHACTWLHKPILQVQQIWKWIVAFTIISWMTDCIFNCSFANFGTLSSLIVLGTHAHQFSNAFIDGQFDPMDHYRNLLNFFHLSNGFDVTFFISYTIAHFTTFEIEQKPFTAMSYWFWWIAADCSNLIILQFGFPSDCVGFRAQTIVSITKRFAILIRDDFEICMCIVVWSSEKRRNAYANKRYCPHISSSLRAQMFGAKCKYYENIWYSGNALHTFVCVYDVLCIVQSKHTSWWTVANEFSFLLFWFRLVRTPFEKNLCL